MIKLVVKTPNDGELQTVCTREYDEKTFVVPEPRNVLSIPDEEGDDESRYYVENVIHRLGEDDVELQLVVRDEEDVLRDVRAKRAQQMRQMQQMQGQQGGGNPFGGGGGGGGKGGNNSPFSL